MINCNLFPHTTTLLQLRITEHTLTHSHTYIRRHPKWLLLTPTYPLWDAKTQCSSCKRTKQGCWRPGPILQKQPVLSLRSLMCKMRSIIMVTKQKILSWNVSIIYPLISNVYTKYYGIHSKVCCRWSLCWLKSYLFLMRHASSYPLRSATVAAHFFCGFGSGSIFPTGI